MVQVRGHFRRNPINIGRYHRRRKPIYSSYSHYKKKRKAYGYIKPHRRRYGGATFSRSKYTRKFTGYRKVSYKTGKAWGKYQKVAYRGRRRHRRRKLFGLL